MTTAKQDPPADERDLELERLKDIAARAQADLQNAKMRMEKEGQDIRVFAMQALVEKLLPTIDNFQRAFAHLPEDLQDNDWVKGLQVMEKQLVSDLESVGLSKIESLGNPVDSEKHEVLQTAEGEADIVVSVLEEGYEFNGKVIRPAKVISGQG